MSLMRGRQSYWHLQPSAVGLSKGQFIILPSLLHLSLLSLLNSLLLSVSLLLLLLFTLVFLLLFTFFYHYHYY